MSDTLSGSHVSVTAVRPRFLSALAHRTVRRGIAVALLMIAAANALIIIYLWARGGGIVDVHGLADALTSTGRITGLLGAYLLLIQVLFLARLPFLERLLGFDRLTVWHRINGKACLYLVLAHVVSITAGYTLTDRIDLKREVLTLLQTYPGMLAATAGTAMILLVVLTSLVIVRRQLRYEAWYLVHLMAYLGILMTWFHEIPTGNELVTNAAASAYWTALYLTTLGLVIIFRFAWLAVRAIRHDLRVVEVRRESPSVVSLYIEGRAMDHMHPQPGQFFLWRFLTARTWWQSHPFSLSAVPVRGRIRITVKDLGDFSGSIGGIPTGTRVLAEGPFGTFTVDRARGRRMALIAGGIGITAVRALAEIAGGEAVLIYRAGQDTDLIFRDELERLAADKHIKLLYVIGPRVTADGSELLSPAHLLALVPDLTERDVYICGPAGLAEYIEKNAVRAGVPRRSIHFERFALA